MVIYVPNSIGAGSNAPTLFWSVFYLIAPCHTYSFSPGFTVDRSRAVLRVTLQLMVLISPLQRNLSLRLFSTGLVVYGFIGYCACPLTYFRLAWLHGSQRRDQLGCQRHHQRFESLEGRSSYDRRIRIQDHDCWSKFGRHHGQGPPCYSLRLFPLPVRDPPVRPDGNIFPSAHNDHRLISTFNPGLRFSVHWNATDHAELLQRAASLQPI